ncbi:glycerophosphodiester phosphodiesterase, partial [Rhizobium leguminosarum]
TIGQAAAGDRIECVDPEGDPDAIWGRMMADGISVIQTDQPAALKAYIEARSA